MYEPLVVHPFADAASAQQIRRPLFEDASAHARLDVFPGMGLKDDVVDTGERQEVAERQAGWPGSDDRDSGAHYSFF